MSELLTAVAYQLGRMAAETDSSTKWRFQQLYVEQMAALERMAKAMRNDVDPSTPLVMCADVDAHIADLTAKVEHLVDQAAAARLDRAAPGGGGGLTPQQPGGGANSNSLARAVGAATLTHDQVNGLRTSWMREFAGKCFYFGLQGACRNNPCAHAHVDMPTDDQRQTWLARVKQELGI